MTDLLEVLATSDGIRPSILEGVSLMHPRPVPRTPVLYEPSIVIVGQGASRLSRRPGVYL